MPLLIAGIASAGISAGMGAYQMYQGSQQEKAGKNAMKGLVQPTYQIPEELKKNLTESELRALEGLPTEQKMEYVKNIERSQQAALQSSADRKGGLLGIQQATNQATDAYTNLVSMDAAQRAANQAMVQQNRNAIAQAKDKQFDVKEGRYQQGLQSAQAMIGAGQQNFMGGLDTIAGSAIQAGGAFMNAQALKTPTGQSTPALNANQVQAANTASSLMYNNPKQFYNLGR